MPRIGRQIAHFEQVDLNTIKAVFSDGRKFRYLLGMRFLDTLIDRGRDQTVSVILKNPSAADANMADATIRKVETFIYHKFERVRNLNILNIFAYRATDPRDLNAMFIEQGPISVIGENNDNMIRDACDESDYIILAWGNRSGIDSVLYEERVFRVKQILEKIPASKILTVSGKKKTKQPLHGLMWGYNYKISQAGSFFLD